MLEKSRELSHILGECILSCNDCMNACLEEEHVKMMTECIRLDNECSVVCNTTLQLIHRDSHFMKDMLELCAKVCKACANECNKHATSHCKECAKACTKCAEACREAMK